jgi:hypothetical protein
VTSLTTEAVSFFSCGLRMKGQPGPKDVACGVLVGMCAVSACSAYKSRLRGPIFLSCMAAQLAAIRCVPRVDRDPHTPSVFRFGAQNRNKVAPARVADTPVDPGLGRSSIGQEASWAFRIRDWLRPTQHIGDCQVLHRDQLVAPDQSSRGFMVEVSARVGNFSVPRGHGLASARAVLGAAHGAAKPLLRGSQPACRGASPAWVVDVIAVGCGCKGGDAQIDTGVTSRCRQRARGDLVTGQNQHPSATFSANLKRLHTTSHLTVGGDLDLSDALQINAVSVRAPTRAVSVLGPLDGGKPAFASEPWISWFPTACCPTEKSRESSIEPTQRGLLARKRPRRHILAQAADLAQLRRLLPVPNGGSVTRPSISTLLERSVVELAVTFHTSGQRDVLARCGSHPKLISGPHADTASGYLVHDAERAFRIHDGDAGMKPSQLLHRGSAMKKPYKALPTDFAAQGALWMYV